jgi:hypothetical protein
VIALSCRAGGTSEVATMMHSANSVACESVLSTRPSTSTPNMGAVAATTFPRTNRPIRPIISGRRGSRTVFLLSSFWAKPATWVQVGFPGMVSPVCWNRFLR